MVRNPQQLRLHRALEEFGRTGKIEELDEAVRPSHSFVTDPILITTSVSHHLRMIGKTSMGYFLVVGESTTPLGK